MCVIKLNLTLAGLLAVALAGPPVGRLAAAPPGDGGPAKDRSILKEPAYRGKDPRYCQLVFGPEAKQTVWLVIDGEDLYVDRNGNGDLTEDGERVNRKPGIAGGGFEIPELAVGDKKNTYTNLVVYWTPQRPGGAKKDFAVEILVDVNKRYCQYAAFKASAESPKDAPVIHFGGPLEMVLLGKRALPAPGKEQEIAAGIGTKSPTGHLATVRHDRGLAPKVDAHPAAEVTYPGKAGAEPIRVKCALDQRCCNVRFYATLRAPAEAGPGKAKLVLSFPGWGDGKVGPVTEELAVGDEPPGPR
jgi:hypothetical protein